MNWLKLSFGLLLLTLSVGNMIVALSGNALSGAISIFCAFLAHGHL